jgi:hypothetical protein
MKPVPEPIDPALAPATAPAADATMTTSIDRSYSVFSSGAGA